MSNRVTGKRVTGKIFFWVTYLQSRPNKSWLFYNAIEPTNYQAYVECQIFVLSLLALMINWRTDIQYV